MRVEIGGCSVRRTRMNPSVGLASRRPWRETVRRNTPLLPPWIEHRININKRPASH
jgi:hypothetical protein